MNSILLIMRCIWELPQNIVGIILWLIVRHEITKVEIIHKRLFFQTHNFGISLGSFVFWSNLNDSIIDFWSVIFDPCWNPINFKSRL